jgi:hypothetical protein
MAKNIETEITEALELTQRKGEDRQKFLGRMMKGGKGLPDKDWNALSEDAQKYINSLIEADDHNKAFPDLAAKSGGASGNTRGKTTSKENEDMATKNATSRGKTGGKGGGGGKAPARGGKEERASSGKNSKSEERTPAKRAASSGGSKPSGGKSNRRKIKEKVVSNPKITVEKLIDQFGGKDGLSDLSISSIRSDTLDTLRVADGAGYWKGGALE